ncbi:DUF6578 domain-containing protein [Streptomyces sp. NBC_00344]|uniref:DUF6578 domain-containing protein n=1 Tax=Streptomyces sp. NBC_00344 TaxID=2975720 RepID=UPI002E1FD060
MTVWRVMYDDWAMECCGTPFSVGDEVVWDVARDTGGCPGGDDGTGVLRVATHGTGAPVVDRLAGRVRSIQVVTEGFAVSPEDGGYRRVPGERSLRQVTTCPKRFARGPAEGGRRSEETGVLVELDTSGG